MRLCVAEMNERPVRVWLPAAVLAVVAFAGSAAALDVCTAGKLKAIGNKESRLLRCQSKVAATNNTSDLSACEMKVSGSFSAAFARAGSWCVGDETTCESSADGCETAVAGAMTETLPSGCEAAKRSAAGRLAKE